jgi:bis(5'-nucleosyl)-tetraphosphatase (symmetrical)
VADYVVGDVQGCYDPLMRLLAKINYDEAADRLWLVGDLVNRGPESLAVLRCISRLKPTPRVVLGNHDLYLLTRLFLTDIQWQNTDDTLQDVLEAPDAQVLGHWLRSQALMYEDKTLGVIMTHAGLAPIWSVDEAKSHAREVEQVLSGEDFKLFLSQLYGNEPAHWSDSLTGMARLRCIVNYFTRMRYCDQIGGLCLTYKGTLANAPAGIIPWFSHPKRKPCAETIVFGHWAALGMTHPAANIYALDTGCVWGQALTALRLQDKVLFSVGTSG